MKLFKVIFKSHSHPWFSFQLYRGNCINELPHSVWWENNWKF